MSSTRGKGLLEAHLASRRAKIADKLIPIQYRIGNILDVGCGKDPLFLKQTRFVSKYGLDKEAETHICGDISVCHFDLSKIDQWPFEDESFNVVTSLAVIEHFSPYILNHILSEANRVLKRRGMLIITTPAPRAQGVLDFLARFRIVSRIEIGDHKHYYREEELVSSMKRTGFEPITTNRFQLGFNIWALGVKK